MNLGALGKQLVKETIGEKVKDVVDSLRPGDLASVAEKEQSAKAPAAPEATIGSIILGQIQAMQNALKEDQELVILCNTGLETLRIFEIFVPGFKVAVLTGVDGEKNVTRFISPVDALQLTCKPMLVQAEAKPVRVRLVGPPPPPPPAAPPSKG